MTPIHPSAIVDSGAELDPTVEVGPFSIIEGPVKISAGTRILSHVHISGNTTIGRDNEIHMGAIIGHVPQHKAYKPGSSGVVIGDRNVIREYASIHRAYHDGHNTMIGDDNFLMGYSHVAHDCQVGNGIVLANGALLAGHSHVADLANISGNVAVHQFVRIGRLAMIGGLARVAKDVPPFMLVEGNSTVRGMNTVGLRRAGYQLPVRTKIKEAYRLLYRSGLNVPQAVEQIQSQFGDVDAIRELVDFIKASVRGICKHAPVMHSLMLQEAEDEG